MRAGRARRNEADPVIGGSRRRLVQVAAAAASKPTAISTALSVQAPPQSGDAKSIQKTRKPIQRVIAELMFITN